MRAREINRVITFFGLSSDAVVVGGIGHDRWCVQQLDGDPTQWEAYYFDRGEKIKHAILPDENAACMYLLGNLALSQVMGKRLIPA